MKKNIVGVIIIPVAVLLLSGIFIWNRVHPIQKTSISPNLITHVDRGIDAKHLAFIDGQIKDLQDKIGDKKDIKDADLWVQMGNYKNIIGDLAGAREAYQTVISLNAISYVAWGNLADVSAEEKDLATAEAAYKKAIDLFPSVSYVEKYGLFLQTYFPSRTDDYEKLITAAVTALGQDPSLISDLAIFYEKEGRLEDAKTHYEVLIRLVPDNVGAKKDLARVEAEIAAKTKQ